MAHRAPPVCGRKTSAAHPSSTLNNHGHVAACLPAWQHTLRSALGKTTSPIAPNQDLVSASLHPYQRAAIDFALAHGGRVLLGHEMGLGKTPMAITIARHCMACGDGRVLIVAPPVLLDQWRSEIKQWWPQATETDIQVIRKGSDQPDPEAKFVVVSYSILAGTKMHPNIHLRSTAAGNPYVTVVVDEAHALKAADSNRTLALVPMLRAAAHVILMTGTPLANACASDVYPLLDGLCGGTQPIEMPSLRAWNARYCLEARKVWVGRRPIERWVGVSDEHGAELHALLGEVMVRKRKEEVLHELPPKRRSKVVLQLKPSDLKAVSRHMALVDDVAGGLHGNGGDRRDGRGGSDGFGEVEASEDDENSGASLAPEVMDAFKVLADAKTGAVCEWLESTFLDGSDRMGERKALIFAHHHSMHDAIASVLSKSLRADEWIHITGKTPQSERVDLLTKLQTQPKCR